MVPLCRLKTWRPLTLSPGPEPGSLPGMQTLSPSVDELTSCNTVQAWFPFSTRLRRRCAGSWPGSYDSYRSAGWACCSACSSQPQRNRMNPWGASMSGKFDCSRSASLSKKDPPRNANKKNTTTIGKDKRNEEREKRKKTTHFTALFVPSQFLRASSISTCQIRHLMGISLPLASTTRRHRSSTMCAMPTSPRWQDSPRLRT